jgi:hypothetical protein
MRSTWRTPWTKLPGEQRARLRAVHIANSASAEFRHVQAALAWFHSRLRRQAVLAEQAAGCRRYLVAARCPHLAGGIAA